MPAALALRTPGAKELFEAVVTRNKIIKNKMNAAAKITTATGLASNCFLTLMDVTESSLRTIAPAKSEGEDFFVVA